MATSRYERAIFSRIHRRALDEDLHLRAQERAAGMAEANGGRLSGCFCGGERTRVIDPEGGWECAACGRCRDPRGEREAQLADLSELEISELEISEAATGPGPARALPKGGRGARDEAEPRKSGTGGIAA